MTAEPCLFEPADLCEKRMPKLSEDLPHPVAPTVCQACGTDDPPGWLAYWRECDEDDKPTPVFVTLCDVCSKKLIEPHPRLYDRLEPNQPYPGLMPLCHDCQLRDRNYCLSKLLVANGGPGLKIVFPQPHMVHLDGYRNGRRTGWNQTIYPGPAVSCEGRVGPEEKREDNA